MRYIFLFNCAKYKTTRDTFYYDISNTNHDYKDLYSVDKLILVLNKETRMFGKYVCKLLEEKKAIQCTEN